MNYTYYIELTNGDILSGSYPMSKVLCEHKMFGRLAKNKVYGEYQAIRWWITETKEA